MQHIPLACNHNPIPKSLYNPYPRNAISLSPNIPIPTLSLKFHHSLETKAKIHLILNITGIFIRRSPNVLRRNVSDINSTPISMPSAQVGGFPLSCSITWGFRTVRIGTGKPAELSLEYRLWSQKKEKRIFVVQKVTGWAVQILSSHVYEKKRLSGITLKQ